MKKNPFVWDLYENGAAPRLTENNVKRVNFLISNDSDYSDFFDEESPTGCRAMYQKWKNKSGYKKGLEVTEVIINITKDLISLIDSVNSTHISTPDGKKDSKNGRTIVAKWLCSNSDVFVQIQKGDADVVGRLANIFPQKFGEKGRNNPSFASKFCAYTNRYLYRKKKDDYVIYG